MISGLIIYIAGKMACIIYNGGLDRVGDFNEIPRKITITVTITIRILRISTSRHCRGTLMMSNVSLYYTLLL